MPWRLLFIFTFLLPGGCSTPLIYPNNYSKNMTVNLNSDAKGSFFTSVNIMAGINNLDKKCNVDYKGHIELHKGKNHIGLQTGQLTYLLINVVHGAGYSSSSYRQGALIYPKKGVKYELNISYIDELFDYNLYSITKGKKKKLKILPQAACKPR